MEKVRKNYHRMEEVLFEEKLKKQNSDLEKNAAIYKKKQNLKSGKKQVNRKKPVHKFLRI